MKKYKPAGNFVTKKIKAFVRPIVVYAIALLLPVLAVVLKIFSIVFVKISCLIWDAIDVAYPTEEEEEKNENANS